MNNQQKQQILEQVKLANNVLVTVSSNPTVDELAASVGLTLALNKMGKHATTVFSGVVPSTIEFLQPEQAIETTTDSLRDFIIALDKSKADKLRYKVENDVVRIFITPYKTKLTEEDLQFSHGDFNVDAVVAIGVTRREDLDKAVTAHGRILHDATVMSITRQENSELGSINWQDAQASSLCEMVASITMETQENILDGQMATAFLTGIIAETDRFRNEKTTPLSLSLSSQLMSSGANQQLIAEKLEEPEAPPVPLHQDQNEAEPTEAQYEDDGTLSIDHRDDELSEEEVDKIHIDEHGNLGQPEDEQEKSDDTFKAEYLPSENEPENFDEDEKDKYAAIEEGPTLPQPASDYPMMQHEKKVLTPPSEEGKPKSDKPFDLQAAMQAATDHDNSYNETEDQHEEKEQPPEEPELKLPEPEEPKEPPKIIPDHSGPMLTHDPNDRNSENRTHDDVANKEPEKEEQPDKSEEKQEQYTPPQPIQEPPAPVVESQTPPSPEPTTEPPKPTSVHEDEQTLSQLEKAVDSPHVPDSEKINSARDAVANASDAQPPAFPTPAVSTGAQNVDLQKVAEEVEQAEQQAKPQEPYMKPEVHDSTAPPPVPPPMTTPQFYDSDGNNEKPI